MVLRILVADRGLMAIRVARTLRDNEITPVGIYTPDDRDLPHRKYLAEDVEISDYNNIKEIISAALELGVDGIHPGYNLIGERSDFAQEVVRKGLVYIGPSPEVLSILRDKIAFKIYAEKLDIPTLPWAEVRKPIEVLEFAETHGYPVVIKPASGSRRLGVKVARDESDVERVFNEAKDISEKYFRDSRLYVEPFLEKVKHLEIQVIGDEDNTVHFYDRECLVTPGFQKIIEEAPSPSITSNIREKLFEYSIMIAKSLRLKNTIVVEYILDQTANKLYFVEANPGLSLEHTVSEMITRKDIVKKQLEVALYSTLDLKQEDIVVDGHAISVKVFNEDPISNRSVSGVINRYYEPSGVGVRVDSGVGTASVISEKIDQPISKITVWGSNRNVSINRLRRALSEYVIDGVATNISLLQLILDKQWFTEGNYTFRSLLDDYQVLINQLVESFKLHAIVISALYEFDNKKVQRFSEKSSILKDILHGERASSIKRHAWYYYISLKGMLERHYTSRKHDKRRETRK
ncbi:MAG: biotin carboxylase N-terminal domain-containing protein [Desulfurococcaceae archaeon]